MYDLILTNCKILSMDRDLSQYRWLAIAKGKIAAVGKTDDYPIECNETIDLQGNTVLPGLIDSHLHGSLAGMSMNSVDLRDANTIEQVCAMMKEKCDHTPKGDLVIGTNLSAEQLQENRLPHKAELDEVSCSHPILIHHVTMHGCMLNSAAMELSQLKTEMDGVDTYADGTANGIVTDDTAYFYGVGHIMENLTEGAIEGLITNFTSTLPAAGVTTVHSLDGQDFPLDESVWHKMQGKHPVHVVNYLETLNVQKAKNYGYPRVGGCIALDGSRVMKTMALNEPYENSAGRGTLYYTDDAIYQFMRQAHQQDMQLSLHVGGERAIDQFIYNLYRVEKEQGFKDLRHRPEHFSMPSERAIELAVEMKLALPMQPGFTYLWDNPNDSLYEKNLGKQRAMRMEPFAEIIRAGGIICGGSDSPISPCSPMWGIHCAVNDPHAFRSVSVTDAIRMFTINGAWAAHEENIKGTIEVGKLADLTIIDKNPYEEKKHIKDSLVQMTLVEGNVVYQRSV